MAISPWLTFEKLKELDTRVNTVETSGLDENPPGTTITIDDIAGNDNNDGFTSPVLTPARATEIARQYNWTDINLEFDFVNFTDASKCSINGSGIVGGGFFNLRLRDSGPFTTGQMNVSNFKQFMDFGRFEVDGNASVYFFNCLCVRGANSGTPFDVINATGGTFIILEEVGYFATNNSDIINCTLDAFIEIINQVDFVTVDFSSLTGSTFNDALIFCDAASTAKVISINLEPTNAISLTGRVLSLPTQKTFNITDSSGITGSLPDIYSASSSYNGTLIRGDFADDTAAGTGGVQSGHFYYNTTNNNIDRKA